MARRATRRVPKTDSLPLLGRLPFEPPDRIDGLSSRTHPNQRLTPRTQRLCGQAFAIPNPPRAWPPSFLRQLLPSTIASRSWFAFFARPLVQRARGHRCPLWLLEHTQACVNRIAKVEGGSRTAPQSACCNEFGDHTTVGSWHDYAGMQFDLNDAIVPQPGAKSK
jgi:hypothetical protein